MLLSVNSIEYSTRSNQSTLLYRFFSVEPFLSMSNSMISQSSLSISGHIRIIKGSRRRYSMLKPRGPFNQAPIALFRIPFRGCSCRSRPTDSGGNLTYETASPLKGGTVRFAERRGVIFRSAGRFFVIPRVSSRGKPPSGPPSVNSN